MRAPRRCPLHAACLVTLVALAACSTTAHGPVSGGEGPASRAASTLARGAGVSHTAGRTDARRAIIVSFDALAEQRALHTVPESAVPGFRALFSGGACAAGARAAFPSLTAPGHASIWTGAYGNVNGIAANSQPPLPRSQHSLLDRVSGYLVPGLRAEPIWLTAAAAGVRVAGHHVTQAPQPPGYPGVDGPEPSLDSARIAAAGLLASPEVAVLNGYNVLVSPAQVITELVSPPREALDWAGLDRLGGSVAPREVTWTVGRDTVFALMFGGDSYDRVLFSASRQVATGSVARLAPVDRPPFTHGELARHFAPGVEVGSHPAPAIVTARLFEMEPDGSRFHILVPEVRIVQGNDSTMTAAYLREIGGWYGNGALTALRAGLLGPAVGQGGDGTAEWRYLESVELMARQFSRGSEWLWRGNPRLMLDYLPLIDEIEHEWLGLVSREAPSYDPEVAAVVQQLRARAWAIADRRLSELFAFVRGDSNAVLLVTGDHGMRPVWQLFRVNAALRDAGLLAIDSAGRVDLARTRALSPAGQYVVVNRRAWRGGFVDEASVDRVITDAERALLGALAADGTPIVTRTWRADAPGTDSLGLGGPAGGDLYYELAPGYTWNADPAGELVTRFARAGSAHGFPSVAEDMHTVFCLWGEGVSGRRTAPARTIDAAPTIAEWLGMPAPAQSVGVSRLRELLGR